MVAYEEATIRVLGKGGGLAIWTFERRDVAVREREGEKNVVMFRERAYKKPRG